jgi:hypothetical protein
MQRSNFSACAALNRSRELPSHGLYTSGRRRKQLVEQWKFQMRCRHVSDCPEYSCLLKAGAALFNVYRMVRNVLEGGSEEGGIERKGL